MKISRMIGVAVAALFLCLTGCAQYEIAQPIQLKIGPKVIAPQGCIEYRKRDGICLVDPYLLDKVHRSAMLHYSPVSDDLQYGVADYWKPSLRGDCEDLALWERAKLKALGIPSDIAIVLTETGEGHAVVHVDGWILDGLHSRLKRVQDLPYKWIALGGPDGKWRRVKL